MKSFFLYFLLLLSTLFCSTGCQIVELHAQKIEIMASHTIKDKYNSLENYKNIEECGFSLARENYQSRDVAVQHLKTALKTNVKLIVGCPELSKDMENTVRIFNNFSSFGGYYLSDEPGADRFSELSKKLKRLRDLDSIHYIWINLHPIYASQKYLQVDSYERYVADYLKIVNPPILSFDSYGLLKKGLRPDYYKNLEIISSYCREKGTPFWAYVLTSQFSSYEKPTKGTLSFQVYNNLAYGAQGIEYFSYRQILTHGLNMTIAPVDTKYKRTSIFPIVKEVNKEISYYSPFFSGSKIIDVSHLSSNIPLGTKRICSFPKGMSVVYYNGEGFVVSKFIKNNHVYIMFVNKDYKREQTIVIQSSNKIRQLSHNKTKRRRLSGRIPFVVEAGSMVLLRVS